MADNQYPQLSTLVAVTFGSRVAVIGDERTIVAAVTAGKPVTVHGADGTSTVTPAARWVKRNGAQRFNLRGETGHGPRGGRKRYGQSVAAFYVTDDSAVTPCEFEDGAALLTAEADSHDAPAAKVTSGTGNRGKRAATSQPQQPAASDPVAALLAALTPDQLAAILAAAGGQQPQPQPQPVAQQVISTSTGSRGTSTVVRSGSSKRSKRSTSTATTAEGLLGL